MYSEAYLNKIKAIIPNNSLLKRNKSIPRRVLSPLYTFPQLQILSNELQIGKCLVLMRTM